MAPAYDRAADRFKDTARLFKLDAETNKEASDRLGLRGVPTLLAWREGRQIGNQAGAPPGDALLTWIAQALGLQTT
jgi:thioredoxin 2